MPNFGHEYYNVNLISARILSDSIKSQPVVLIQNENKREIIELVKSYGIEKIIFQSKFEISNKTRFWLKIYAFYLWLSNRTKKQLLNVFIAEF